MYFSLHKKIKFKFDLTNIALHYAACHDMMEHWQGLYGDRILSVRYEDFVRNPVDVGRQIYEFCGLDYDPAAVRHEFTTDGIGHWRNYEPHLDDLFQALGDLAH